MLAWLLSLETLAFLLPSHFAFCKEGVEEEEEEEEERIQGTGWLRVVEGSTDDEMLPFLLPFRCCLSCSLPGVAFLAPFHRTK